MIIAVGILSLIIITLIIYILYFRLQLRNMNRQLKKRFTEHTRQPITLELMNKELNTLAANINKCLKAEENLRLESIREEKQFKEMIANISHDLRTPLTAIKGYQQLLEKEQLTKYQWEKLSIAQKYVTELENLTEHFFEYSYLINAEQKPDPQFINLTNLITECLAESVNAFEEKGIKINYEEVPPIYIYGDKQMTIRILQNLIRNANRHSAGDIDVHIYKNKDNAVITFSNPAKDAGNLEAERLFERFYTADKARNSTGLGLHIVKLLAEQMEGKTRAELNKEQLEIQVELPLNKKV